MANPLPIEVHEGVIHTSPASRLARIAGKNLLHMARNRAVITVVIAAALTLTVGVVLGWLAVGAMTGMLLVVLGLWAWRRPVSFRRQVTLRVWACLVGIFKYRRRWRTVLKKSGVIKYHEDPARILRVTATKGTEAHPGSVHTVRIRMNDGDTIHGTYTENLRAMTQSFNAVSGSVIHIQDRPRQLKLQFITKDPLIQDVAPYPTTTDQLFTGYPLAKQDDLEPWHLKLLGTHVAVGGETGSGKGSVFQTITKAVQPARRDGIAKIFALDNKGGVELGLGGERLDDGTFISPHFDQFAYRSVRESLRLLDLAWREAQRRQKIMLGNSRLWAPGPNGNEYILVLVDEIGAFKWQGDRKLALAASNRLSLLITQVRAFGITIVYAGQDLRKDIVAFRGQTPTRISLRTQEPDDIDMLLGNGAWRHGARSDEIPDSMPGTAYVTAEGKKGFQRIRFPNITDDMITGNEPTYAQDVAEARVMAEQVAANHQDRGIERFGGFA